MMSGVRETNLWKWLKKARMEMRYDLQMNRVENSTMGGMPDVEGATANGQFWIELKSTGRPKRENTPIRFAVKGRGKQKRWLRKRYNLNYTAFMLLQVGGGAYGARAMYLVRGNESDAVYAGVPESELDRMDLLRHNPSASDVIYTIEQHIMQCKALGDLW